MVLKFRSRVSKALIFALSAAGFLAVVMAIAPAGAASAHDYVVSSSPTADSTVTQPVGSVSVTFNDLVLDLAGDGSSSVMEVTGPDGGSTHFETGCASILGRVVSAPVALGAAGRYQVSWQVVSSDGHPVSGSFGFTYSPAAGSAAGDGSGAAGNDTAASGTPSASAVPSASSVPSASAVPSAGSATAPACGSAGGSSGAPVTALPSAGASGASSSGGLSIDPWVILVIAGAIVLLAVGGVVVILVVSRRAARDTGGDDK
ncbi:copper resistance protein CopC [Subtercola sp. PAMC28395]|uniref:copper resistance CopC family protein n=1 Tax=Subtercola sp. PAMC28395 TaxID=2846775 RepID=UPI001C0DDF0E|nr:copper resistance CopC family protein [Subtercola sp. PAMC28395]QWT24907.1 copper resistance protein CopC [Subtercola sp. PAMC28395]